VLSKKTILIAEDEEAILLALQRILELTGEYEVLTASNGQSAMEKIKGFIPDMIISDISMPNIDGIAFCKEIRKNPLTKSTPFIFLTGKKEKLIEGINAGGDDFLMKPFNVEEVLVKIEAIFRRISQTREQASQHKGRIEDLAVQEIMELCLRERISGELILQNGGEIGKIKLQNGDFKSVEYRKLSDDAALDALMLWKKGTFVIRPSEIQIKVDSPSKIKKADLSLAQQLSHSCWWVGFADAENHKLYNVYLRIFNNNNKIINTLIDPGSPVFYKEISAKISHILNDDAVINLYLLTDSDPDVCLNSEYLRKANPRTVCITSTQNWESIKHYEINIKSVKMVNLKKTEEIKLASGHQLKLIPVPFCKSPASFMTYDLENKILFSGALFSSMHYKEGSIISSIFADESDWDDMADFHKLNIPSVHILQSALKKIKALKPKPEIIAPRYGKIISKDRIDFFIDSLHELEVGIDMHVSGENEDDISVSTEEIISG
jgi:CheY-like chemotaxis protein